MNALQTGTLRELADSLAELEKDNQIRVILLTGGKNFCAGADIREMKGKTPEAAESFANWVIQCSIRSRTARSLL
jgi:enoyl-CoA hydratase/carnithine racemase